MAYLTKRNRKDGCHQYCHLGINETLHVSNKLNNLGIKIHVDRKDNILIMEYNKLRPESSRECTTTIVKGHFLTKQTNEENEDGK